MGLGLPITSLNMFSFFPQVVSVFDTIKYKNDLVHSVLVHRNFQLWGLV